MRLRTIACAFVALLATVSAAEKSPELDGNWYITSQGGAASEVRQMIVKFATKASGELQVEVVAQPPMPKGAPKDYKPPVYTVGSPKMKDGVLTFTIVSGPSKTTFEGAVDPKEPERFLGTQGDENRSSLANLVKTDATELKANNQLHELPVPESLKAVQKLRVAINQTFVAFRREKDEEKKELLKANLADAEKAFRRLA